MGRLGKRGNPEGHTSAHARASRLCLGPWEDPKHLRVWDSMACLSLHVSTQLICPKAAGLYWFSDISFIAPVQLLALTTLRYCLWLGTFKKKVLYLAPLVTAEWCRLTRGEAGGGRGLPGPQEQATALLMAETSLPTSALAWEHSAGEGRLGRWDALWSLVVCLSQCFRFMVRTQPQPS